MASELDEIEERTRILAEVERRMNNNIVRSELNAELVQVKSSVDNVTNPIFKDFKIDQNEVPDFMSLARTASSQFLKDLNSQLEVYVETGLRVSKTSENDARQLLLSEIEEKLRAPGVMDAIVLEENKSSHAAKVSPEEKNSQYMKAYEVLDVSTLKSANDGLRIYIDNGFKVKTPLTSQDIDPYARSNKVIDWADVLQNGFPPRHKTPASIKEDWSGAARLPEQGGGLKSEFNKGDDYKVVDILGTRLGSGGEVPVSESSPVVVRSIR